MGAQAKTSNETGPTNGVIPATLFAFTLATGMEQWTGNGLSVTLTDLTGALGASSDETSWAVTVYSTAFAVSVALMAWSLSVQLKASSQRLAISSSMTSVAPPPIE